MKLFFVFLLLSSAFSTRKPEAKDTDWVLKKDEDGVKIYVRRVENSKLKELKLTTTIDSKLSALTSFLSDKSNYSNWVYACEESYVLKNVSELESYHYQRTSPPWPVSDRDVVVHSIISQAPDSRIVTVKTTAVSNYMSLKKGIVRVDKFNSSWILKPTSVNKTELEHYMSVDPGGDIPAWMINMAVTEGPSKTIKNFKRLITSYQKNLTPSIKD
jgi:hypothetical protein